MVVCVAFATLLAKTARKEGSMGDTRLSPIALALEEALAQETLEGTPKEEPGRAEATAVGVGSEPEEEEEEEEEENTT
jgi:hypothetical protein